MRIWAAHLTYEVFLEKFSFVKFSRKEDRNKFSYCLKIQSLRNKTKVLQDSSRNSTRSKICNRIVLNFRNYVTISPNSTYHEHDIQGNDWYKGLIPHFDYRRSSHRRKGAASHIWFIWFGYIAHLSQWGCGGTFLVLALVSWRLPTFAAPRGRGVGSQLRVALWLRVSLETSFDSKQPKLEPKTRKTCSGTMFRLFKFNRNKPKQHRFS
jgi:hypothetical protein